MTKTENVVVQINSKSGRDFSGFLLKAETVGGKETVGTFDEAKVVYSCNKNSNHMHHHHHENNGTDDEENDNKDVKFLDCHNPQVILNNLNLILI